MAEEHENFDSGRGVQLLNEAHHYICGQVKLYPTLYAPLLLVAGQAEYPLTSIVPNTPSGGILKIWQGYYYLTAGVTPTPIYVKNVDTLFEDMGPGWDQVTSSSSPYAFYERGGNIGLYPAPNITSSGGYPNATFQYDTIPILFEASPMPAVDTIYPWVYYMCWLQVAADSEKAASVLAASKALYWKWFLESMKKLRDSVNGRVARDHARVSKNIKRVRRA